MFYENFDLKVKREKPSTPSSSSKELIDYNNEDDE